MENEIKDVVFEFENCDNSTYIELGDKLREIRNNRGFTQNMLSEITNRDRTGLSAYERGVKKPSLNGLYEIASALGYKFKITFEDKEVNKDMNLKREVFSEKFLNQFIKDMSANYNGYNHKWTIEYKDSNKVSLKSDSGDEVTLTSEWDSESRYVPINLYINGEIDTGVEIYRDLDELYNIDEMTEIRQAISECLALEEVLLCRSFSENNTVVSKLVNTTACFNLQYLNYLRLKGSFKLKDENIIEIIEQTLSKYKNNRFLDTLNSSNEIDNLETNLFTEGFILIKNYIDNDIINIKSAKYLVDLAYLLRLERAIYPLENEAENLDLVKAIINHEKEWEFSHDIFPDMIDDCIREYVKHQPERSYYLTDSELEKDCEKQVEVIFSVVKAFYPSVREDSVRELISIDLERFY